MDPALTSPNTILNTTCTPKIKATLVSVLRPESDEHWELYKAAIGQLYIDFNLPVNDVIDIMKECHHFFASPKMYRNQFAKWKWRKYRPKAPVNRATEYETRSSAKKSCLRSATERARAKSSLGTDHSSAITTPATQWTSPHIPNLTFSPMDDEMSQHKYRTARDMPVFVENFSSKRDTASIEGCKLVMSVFYHGLNKLLSGRYEKGKALLDWAFSQIWKVVRRSNREVLLNFCLLEPFSLVALSLSRASTTSCRLSRPNCHRIIDDILREYLSYLTGLTQSRLGDHPMASTVAGMRYALDSTPQHLGHFASFVQEQVIDEMVKVGLIHVSGDPIVLFEDSIARLGLGVR